MRPDHEMPSTLCVALTPGNRTDQKSLQVLRREKLSMGKSTLGRLGLGGGGCPRSLALASGLASERLQSSGSLESCLRCVDVVPQETGPGAAGKQQGGGGHAPFDRRTYSIVQQVREE